MNALGCTCSTMLVKAVQFWKQANDIGNFSTGNRLGNMIGRRVREGSNPSAEP